MRKAYFLQNVFEKCAIVLFNWLASSLAHLHQKYQQMPENTIKYDPKKNQKQYCWLTSPPAPLQFPSKQTPSILLSQELSNLANQYSSINHLSNYHIRFSKITMTAPTCTRLQLYPRCIQCQDAHLLQACKLPRLCICPTLSSPTSQNSNAQLISPADETLSQKKRGFHLHDLRFLGAEFCSCLVHLVQIQPGGVTASLVCGPPQSQGPAPCSGRNFHPSYLLSQTMLQLTPANIAEGFVR